MANALFVDALKGYEIYLKRRGDVTLDGINLELAKIRRNPIAQRTFSHYYKLMKHGFRSYIPINKFDVFQSLGKVQLAADRRRYKRDDVEIPVSFSRNGTSWQPGKLIDKSLVGFGLLTDQKFPVSKGTMGWVQMAGYKNSSTAFESL